LDKSSGGIYNLLLHSQSHCNHTALILHRLTSCILLVLLIPICCLACVLLVASLIHFLSGTSWELLRTELAENFYWTETRTETESGFIWNLLYNLRTDHTQKTSHTAAIVEICVVSHCVATVTALIIANPLLLHYPATSSKHSLFYCCVPFKVCVASTVTAWGKHATLWLDRWTDRQQGI
jgi:ABC-type phosphate transport system permease subunit